MLPALAVALLLLQSPQATLTGVVRDDASGSAVPGALVVLTDLDRGTSADGDGRYRFDDVPAGPQHVRVEALGYESRALHALVPRAGRLELDVSLPRRPLPLDPVRVHAPVAVRGVDPHTGSADVFVSAAAMRNHPLLAETDALQALSGAAVTLDPEAPSGVHIRGGSSDQTAYLLDDVPVLNPYHAAGIFSAWNPDALGSVEVRGSAPPPGLPAALAGVVAARVREPDDATRAQGAVSSTQSRVAIDGPLGVAHWLVSARAGYPDLLGPSDEASYLRGSVSDWLARVELPVAGGSARVLGLGIDNAVDTDARIGSADDVRNQFGWQSRSLGGGWRGATGPLELDVAAWSAQGDAEVAWSSSAHGATALASVRDDAGVRVEVARTRGSSRTGAGIRWERQHVEYRVTTDSAGGVAFDSDTRGDLVTIFAAHERSPERGLGLDAGAALTRARDGWFLSPRTRVRWRAGDGFGIGLAASRLTQFAHSLRNAESVVSRIFPADLWIGAADRRVEPGIADQLVLDADWRPFPGARVRAEAWTRASRGLPLVAPAEGEPFVIDSFVTGRSSAHGFALDAAASGARYALLVAWAWQRVRLEYGDASYTPGHGSEHLVDAGIVVFPSATATVRLSASAAFGRRGTLVTGGLELEACNLLDEGCEFAGSPTHERPPGDARLPAYVRVDLGARKHWHVRIGGRDASIALFGTVTNLFGFGNVMTWVVDPESGEHVAVEMRPLSPLVLGVDWRL